MKIKKIISVILLLFFGGFITETSAQENTDNDYLTGSVSLQELETDTLFSDIFAHEFKNYQVNHTKKISDLLNNINIKIVLGTWCHDSQIQVPRFLKVVSEAGYDLNRIEILAVNRNKELPGQQYKALNIKRVPTFIFTNGNGDGTEIGRIIESPEKTLESDLIDLLQ